jgi:large subunit ribosomal protein L3
MGRRRTKAPRRGSLAYSPRKRAKRPIGRVRSWPAVALQAPRLLGFSGYKVGMNYVFLLDEAQGSPTFGQEIVAPVTVVETPPLLVAGVRAYMSTVNGVKAFGEAWAKELPRDAARSPAKPKTPPTSFTAIEAALPTISALRPILFTQPRQASVPQKRPEVFEVAVAGGTMLDQLHYLTGLLGTTVQAADVFTEGQFVDVVAVTKGKGVQGPVKRWGVKTRHHKSRKTVRGIGTLGPWSPHYVMYTVPRAGQMGFHQRTERNRRVLQISEDAEAINPAGGFPHYGLVRGPYLLLKGSVPGPAKRLLKMRYADHPPTTEAAAITITYLGTQAADTP